MSEGKKRFYKSDSFSCRTFFRRFCPFFDKNTTDLVNKFYTFGHVGGKNKKKTHKCLGFFFSSGTFSARRSNRGPKNIVSVALHSVHAMEKPIQGATCWWSHYWIFYERKGALLVLLELAWPIYIMIPSLYMTTVWVSTIVWVSRVWVSSVSENDRTESAT